MITTKKLLETLIFSGGSAGVVYWILSLPAVLKFLEQSRGWFREHLGVELSVVKRISAIVLSTLLSTLAYLPYAGLGYADLPTNTEGWINLILSLGTLAFTGSQVLHIKKLQK